MSKPRGGFTSHHRPNRGKTDEWLTPPELFQQLGCTFDLDPCSPTCRPWDTARRHYDIRVNGLKRRWKGRVWLNPPYGPEAKKWLKKLSVHGNGIALIFARTETESFFRYVWGKAHAVLFIKGRITFYTVRGEPARFNAGAPSVLVAYGSQCSRILKQSKVPGKYIQLR